MAKNIIKKSVDIESIKQKIYSDVSMMSGIKLKGIDTMPNQLVVKCKTGSTKVTSGSDITVIKSKPRFISFFIWDIFLDRIKTNKVHNKVVQIVTSL